MIRALWHIALFVLSGLAAWLLIVVALVYCGPVLTIGAILFLTGVAAWRGHVPREREPTPGRERIGL